MLGLDVNSGGIEGELCISPLLLSEWTETAILEVGDVDSDGVFRLSTAANLGITESDFAVRIIVSNFVEVSFEHFSSDRIISANVISAVEAVILFK